MVVVWLVKVSNSYTVDGGRGGRGMGIGNAIEVKIALILIP